MSCLAGAHTRRVLVEMLRLTVKRTLASRKAGWGGSKNAVPSGMGRLTATAPEVRPRESMVPRCWYLNGSNGRPVTLDQTFQAT